MSHALEIRNVTRRFGSLLAVNDVSFAVESGQVVGFIGPNGAGKTTTMRICATLDLPDAGDVLIDGISVLADPRAVRMRLGFMPDAYGAYPNTTVFEYLDFFARAYGKRGRHRRQLLHEVTEFTALDDMLQKNMDALSKGMKQRLCLAKTLLHNPAFMILDEPAAGLDPRARVELRELVKVLAQRGKAILISSHILTELSEICDGVAVIERGKIRATGSVDEIRRRLRPHRVLEIRCMQGGERACRFLLEQPFVSDPRVAEQRVTVNFEGDEQQAANLLTAMIQAGLEVAEFKSSEIDLEEVFLSLTEGEVQ